MERPAIKAALAISALILIWGSTWSVIAIGLRDTPPFTGAAVRFAIASVLLLAIARKQRVPLGRTRLERRLWWVNALLSFTISYGVVYWGEQWVPSALAAVLFTTFPLLVALFAHWLLPGEQLTGRTVIGIVLGFGGVVWIFSDDLSGLGGPMALSAAAVMLLSPLSASLGSVLIKRWGSGVHPLSLTAVPMGICAVLLGSLALILEREREVIWSARSIGAVLYLAIAGSAVTFSLYFWLLQKMPATRLSLITYGVPIVAMTLGVVFLDEPISARMIGGTVMVLLGVSLALRRRDRSTQPGSPRRS